MIENILMPREIISIIDIRFQICLVQTLQIIVLKQLNRLLILQYLHRRNEDLSIKLTSQGWSHPHDHFHIISLLVLLLLALLQHLNLI